MPERKKKQFISFFGVLRVKGDMFSKYVVKFPGLLYILRSEDVVSQLLFSSGF